MIRGRAGRRTYPLRMAVPVRSNVVSLPGKDPDVTAAAETVVRLMRAGVLPYNGEVIRRCAAVLRIPAFTIREAWDRLDGEIAGTKPNRKDVTGAGRCTVSKETAEKRRAKAVERNLEITERDCVGPCGRTALAIEEFPLKDKRTMRRGVWCRSCLKEYQKERYRYVAEAGLVRGGRLRLDSDAPFVGDLCPNCETELRGGDEVTIGDVKLRHCNCPPA